jgi:hypothetical protein
MVMMPMMAVRFPSAVAMLIRPVAITIIRRMTISAVSVAVGWLVMATASHASTKRQQHQQDGKWQGYKAHLTPPFDPFGSRG